MNIYDVEATYKPGSSHDSFTVKAGNIKSGLNEGETVLKKMITANGEKAKVYEITEISFYATLDN